MADADQKPPLFRHISDIDVWLTPDRNYFFFILFSVFGGFLALDHIYLRSFSTAFQKVLYNIFGLGIWYWWDICQILTEGKRVQSEGLTSPFDWTQGIGRGVFGDPFTTAKFMPEKSYILWAFLAAFGGFLALDKFYLGDYIHGITKIISIFSPLILFGVLWVVWDAFHAIFLTKDVVSGSISLPFPLKWFGYNETDGKIFLPSAPTTGGVSGGVSGIAQAIASISPEKQLNMISLLGIPTLAKTFRGLTSKLRTLETKATAAGAAVTEAGAAIVEAPPSLPPSPVATATA